MRFHVALDSLEKENAVLRYSIFGLLFLTTILCAGILYVSVKDPLIIERSCFSKAVSSSSAAQTPDEILGFLDFALKARFDSAFNDPSFLNADQLLQRNREQSELQKQKMTQKISINQINILPEGKVAIEADRVISVGPVRTMLRFPLVAELSTVTRSTSNPYGLLLVNVQPAESVIGQTEKGKRQ